MNASEKKLLLNKIPQKAWSFIKSRTIVKIQSRIDDRKAARELGEWQNKRRRASDIIRCCFVVQMPELWNKQSSVYDLMSRDSRFETWMIIVPHYQVDKKCLGDYGDELQFFEAECKNGNILYALNNGKWNEIDLKQFDYVFFQRPYDWYLPEAVKSSNAVGKAGVCYIPYATPEMKKTVIYPKSFFRNIYLGFMEDGHAADFNSKRFGKTSRIGTQRFLNVGYPSFENCMALSHECLYKRVLWTPRWSYDPIVGGSHFVEYVQPLMDYDWGDAKLSVRPHPMMWKEFIRIGKMTQQQIDELCIKWKKLGITQDMNKDIEVTFQETDILISDNSSVIPMFFMTGKPIIYCEFAIEYSSLFATVIPGLYIARNWDDVEKYLNQLLQHDDPLITVRQQIIEENFSMHNNATKHIVETIISDFFN